jgi:hypothetical protein
MPTGNGETNPVLFLYAYLRVDFYAFQGASHVTFACSGKSAIILAQVASQTPFFVYINSFHDLPLQKKRYRPQSGAKTHGQKPTAPLLFKLA